MPHIPGVSVPGEARGAAPNPAVRMVVGLLAVLLVVLLGSRLMLRTKHTEPPPPAPPAQIEVPTPAVDTTPPVPRATQGNPEVATVAEMSKPWSSRDFFFVNPVSNQEVAALLIRLPSGPASRSEGYWAFAMTAPFGSCKLEYLQDMKKLTDDYDFHAARHPMVGDPCSRTLFDPLKMANIPGNIWVRGGIVQGSDLRPPLGIEIQIRGKSIEAVKME
jgi:hypothetical protein